jgi:hypothetical protein
MIGARKEDNNYDDNNNKKTKAGTKTLTGTEQIDCFIIILDDFFLQEVFLPSNSMNHGSCVEK